MMLHVCVFVSVEYNMTGETGKMAKKKVRERDTEIWMLKRMRGEGEKKGDKKEGVNDVWTKTE